MHLKRTLLFFTICCSLMGFSQDFDTIIKPVKTMDHAFSKYLILEMTDRRTILIQDDPRNECYDMSVYDAAHELKFNTKVNIDSIKKIFQAQIFNIKEVNGKVFLFYKRDNLPHNKSALYTLEINPSTGKTYTNCIFRESLADTIQENEFGVVSDDSRSCYTVYTVVSGRSGGNTLLTFTYDFRGKLIHQLSKSYPESYKIEVVDVLLQKNNLFVCLNYKYYPKEAPKNWLGAAKYNYIPENKVYVIRSGLESKKYEEQVLPAKTLYYVVKARFSFDEKHQVLNLLFSGINPKDKYARIPEVYNALYRFPLNDFLLFTEKPILNEKAIQLARNSGKVIESAAGDPKKVNENSFVNFPQYFSTDTSGSQYMVFQTVYNYFNKPDQYVDLFYTDMVLYITDPEGNIQQMELVPYMDKNGGMLEHNLQEFSFSHDNLRHWPSQSNHPISYINARANIIKTGGNCAIISNTVAENLEKKIGDKFIAPNYKTKRIAMITTLRKNHYNVQSVFPQTKEMEGVMLYNNVASFNPQTGIYAVFCLNQKSDKRYLTWVYFRH